MPHKKFRQLIYSTLCLILNGQIFLHPQHKNQLLTYPTHSYIAITTDQLSRLPAAYHGNGPVHKVTAYYIRTADKHVGSTIDFSDSTMTSNSYVPIGDARMEQACHT